MLIDQEKNIVIFPLSKCKKPVELADGTVETGAYLTAYYPIEVSYPYTAEVLAEKIKYGIEQWDIHECHFDSADKNIFEEKYYGVKGFTKATKGKRYVSLGWNSLQAKFVELMLPWKSRSSTYMIADTTKLPDDADWIDFANAVIKYVDMDITQTKLYKHNKNKLNL